MMNLPSRAACILGLTAIAGLLVLCPLAQGLNMYTYDLDSLVYMSSQIVEGKLGESHRVNNVPVSEFFISAVHKGTMKAGQTIDVTALDFYSVSCGGSWASDQLKPGDELFLFLDRARTASLYHIPTNAEIYWAVASGVRFVVGEKAVRFVQLSNPGPYTALIGGAEANSAIPTVVQLRGQIHDSIPRVAKWKPLLEREATTNDIPALLGILREEKDQGRYSAPNSITDVACKHLSSLHDIPSLTKAVGINSSLAGALGPGFGTVAGRAYLRIRAADTSELSEERIQWANLLAHTGEGTQEEHHLRRIAELAALPQQEPQVRVALLVALQQVDKWRRFGKAGKEANPGAREDMIEAGAILKALSAATDSEETKYEIDLVLSAYGIGPTPAVICILKQGRYEASTRTLRFEFSISGPHDTNRTLRVAFFNTKTAQKWNAPANFRFGCGSAKGPNSVHVPEDLPPGRYRVFFEFVRNQEIQGASHYFEADL